MTKPYMKSTWEIIEEGRKNLFDFKRRQFSGIQDVKKKDVNAAIKFDISRFNSGK